jgi:hypothetical protein
MLIFVILVYMGYSYTNSKGVVYFLHSKGNMFYFSKNASQGIDLPLGYVVVENSRTGLPVLRKKLK